MNEREKIALLILGFGALVIIAALTFHDTNQHDRAKWRAVVERCEQTPGCKLTPHDYRRAGMYDD